MLLPDVIGPAKAGVFVRTRGDLDQSAGRLPDQQLGDAQQALLAPTPPSGF